jgi:hypothetical protein
MVAMFSLDYAIMLITCSEKSPGEQIESWKRRERAFVIWNGDGMNYQNAGMWIDRRTLNAYALKVISGKS